MRLIVSSIILFMILFLLAVSFKRQPNESVSSFDMAGAAFTGAGESDSEQTQSQMQNEATVRESQEEGATVLDFATQSAKEELHKWEESSSRLMNYLWEEAKESAFLMAADMAELIYPTKPLKLKRKENEQQHTQAGMK